jgi:cytochrome b subunit of formate dehydrogenase
VEVVIGFHAYWKMGFTAFISTLILGYDRKREVKENTKHWRYCNRIIELHQQKRED